MKTYVPARTSSKPAGPARTEKDGTAPPQRVVQATPRSDLPQAGLHDFSRMELPFRSSAADGVVHEAARLGLSTPAGSLPHLEKIQHSFGRHNIRATPAHVTPDAAESAEAIGAKGYTAYGHVVLGRGSDLRTAAHEAAHVVQQQQRIQLSGGTGRVGDSYERHADAVAERVVAGRSAEALLDRVAAAADHSTGTSSSNGSTVVQAKIVPIARPGEVAKYEAHGHTEGHDNAASKAGLWFRMSARDEIRKKSKGDAKQMAELNTAGIGNNSIENIFLSAKGKPDLKTTTGSKTPTTEEPEVKASDETFARDQALAANTFDRQKKASEPELKKEDGFNISHKLPSVIVQQTIATAATKAVAAIPAPDWQPVETMIQKMNPDNSWANRFKNENAQNFLKAVDKQYKSANKNLDKAKQISDGGRRKVDKALTKEDKNGEQALDALAEAIANSPENLFLGSAKINKSIGGFADYNTMELPAARSNSAVGKNKNALPPFGRAVTSDSREKISLIPEQLASREPDKTNKTTKYSMRLNLHRNAMATVLADKTKFKSSQTSSVMAEESGGYFSTPANSPDEHKFGWTPQIGQLNTNNKNNNNTNTNNTNTNNSQQSQPKITTGTTPNTGGYKSLKRNMSEYNNNSSNNSDSDNDETKRNNNNINNNSNNNNSNNNNSRASKSKLLSKSNTLATANKSKASKGFGKKQKSSGVGSGNTNTRNNNNTGEDENKMEDE